ncbi:LTA synthase family protein [Salinigranum rubrum]|uniref:LTA synthase family protein n=1 Tax=Salinigranum rubrum TaxID=755307 RepID=UPI001C1FC55F|nr:LTA synthase family protein [Salinigranum rubrum]
MDAYNLSGLKRATKEPELVLRELNQLLHSSFGRHGSNPDGQSIFEKDWDNLLILDACRYDFFERQSELPGELYSRTTLGSCTPEFIEYNFRDRQLHDTVYVTANSWFLKLKDEINAEVHDLIDLLSSPERKYSDPEHNIVLADTITNVARQANEKYPNKRLIVHYIQPHHPFVGPTGKKYFQTNSSSLREVVQNEPASTRDLVMEAYSENVDHVLKAVENLLPDLQGKTAVTADHGEMLGERHEYIPIREYGHPAGIWSEILTNVPWHIHTSGIRKEIIAEQPHRARDTLHAYEVDERLKTLGYKM